VSTWGGTPVAPDRGDDEEPGDDRERRRQHEAQPREPDGVLPDRTLHEHEREVHERREDDRP
jgi:hypothetical protein